MELSFPFANMPCKSMTVLFECSSWLCLFDIWPMCLVLIVRTWLESSWAWNALELLLFFASFQATIRDLCNFVHKINMQPIHVPLCRSEEHFATMQGYLHKLWFIVSVLWSHCQRSFRALHCCCWAVRRLSSETLFLNVYSLFRHLLCIFFHYNQFQFISL